MVAAALTLFLSASCSRKVEYERISYLTLYDVAYDINEDIGQLSVPVLINNASGAEVQVAVTVTPDSAEEGVHYNVVSPANGILTFSGDTDSLAVVIEISDAFIGEFIQDKAFTVSVASMTDGLFSGAFTEAYVNIIDIDHPLFPFIGTWEGTMNGLFQAPTYETSFKVKSNKDDTTFSKLIVDAYINPYFTANGIKTATYDAVVRDGVMTVGAEQPVGYSDVVLLGFDAADPNNASSYDDVHYEKQEDGTLLQANAFGAYTPSGGGFYEIYLGGAVFTRK